jgi:hypothetical protein
MNAALGPFSARELRVGDFGTGALPATGSARGSAPTGSSRQSLSERPVKGTRPHVVLVVGRLSGDAAVPSHSLPIHIAALGTGRTIRAAGLIGYC